MNQPRGGSRPPEFGDLTWVKSSASSANGGCLEVAFLGDGRVALRDSEDLGNPPFVVSRHVWDCFVDGAAKGEFVPPAG